VGGVNSKVNILLKDSHDPQYVVVTVSVTFERVLSQLDYTCLFACVFMHRGQLE